MRHLSIGFTLVVFQMSCATPKVTPVEKPEDVSIETRDWENEQVIEINKEPGRVFSVPFATRSEALSLDWKKSSRIKMLNGIWKFHYTKIPEERPRDFFRSGFSVADWKDIRVPGNWQTQGFGVPIYSNVTYPFKKDWPRVTSEPDEDWLAHEYRNPVGSYFRTFDVPKKWKGDEVYIHFGGVESAFYIWVNGKRVGYSQGSYLPAEFRVTPYLKTGQNTLAIEVYRWSDGSYLEDQDFWRLSGIFREVFLYATPKAWLRDYFFLSDLDDEYKDATFKVRATLANPSGSDTQARLAFELLDGAGLSVWRSEKAVDLVKANSMVNLQVDGKLTSPNKWTGETPNLYKLVITVMNATGQVVSAHVHPVGFREMGVSSNGEFLVNGKPIIFKGVNRHETDPAKGRTVSRKSMRKDVRTFKRFNINAVRTSHYPNHPDWYKLCDEYGIYVIDEANIESHGYGYGKASLAKAPAWEKAHVMRGRRMILRDRNHPSVVIWSMGNEAGYGTNFEALSKEMRRLDTSRPLHYERAPMGVDALDMDSVMYPRLKALEKAGQKNSSRPFFVCEYAHSMGNGTGNLDEYVDAFEKHQRLIGGCIWDYIDQGLRIPNPVGKKSPNGRDHYFAFGNDLAVGKKPHSGNFCMNGITDSNHDPTAKTSQVKYTYQPADFTWDGSKLRLKNEFFHTDISDNHTFKWSVLEDGETLKSGTAKIPSVAPWTEVEMPFSLPAFNKLPGADYQVLFEISLKSNAKWAKAGHIVGREQFELPKKPGKMVPLKSLGPVTVRETVGVVEMTAGTTKVLISKSLGTPVSFHADGKELLAGEEGLSPNFYRAMGDNDKHQRKKWDKAGIKEMQQKVTGFRVDKRKNTVEVDMVSQGKGSFVANLRVRYVLLGDGTLLVDAGIVENSKDFALPRAGFRVALDKSLEHVEYYGRGPEENYVDRKTSQTVGKYKTTVTNMYVDYAKPQFMGNREDTSWVVLRNKTGGGLLVQAPLNKIGFSALHFTDQELAASPHPYDIPVHKTVFLSLDAAQTGLGGASCGPSYLPKYVIDGPFRLTLAIRAFQKGDKLKPLLRRRFKFGPAPVPQ